VDYLHLSEQQVLLWMEPSLLNLVGGYSVVVGTFLLAQDLGEVGRDIQSLGRPLASIQGEADVPSCPCSDGGADDAADTDALAGAVREDLDASYEKAEACCHLEKGLVFDVVVVDVKVLEEERPVALSEQNPHFDLSKPRQQLA
jgi:hypothetical protein